MILGIDPGRSKTGWALVCQTGELAFSGVFLTSETGLFLKILACPLTEWEKGLRPWICERDISIALSCLDYVALGNGIGNEEVLAFFDQWDLRVVVVDEKNTTLAARKLYWRLHRPAFWQRLMPRSLWIPPRLLDDLAAWEIALRSMSFCVSLSENVLLKKRC